MLDGQVERILISKRVAERDRQRFERLAVELFVYFPFCVFAIPVPAVTYHLQENTYRYDVVQI